MLYFFGSCMLIGVFLLLYMYQEAHRDTVLTQELSFTNFPKTLGEVRIFFISDVHRRKISTSLLKKIKGNVDMVVIGGDLVEKGVPLSRVKENIQLLNQLGPVYFVYGNNDYEVEVHDLDALLLDLKVKVLDNTAALFESYEGEKLSLLGISDINLHQDNLEDALRDSEEDAFRILVSHNPKVMDQLLPEHNISLVLSGHTHGGQIRILGHGPYKLGGIEKVGETTLLVSNGHGTTSLPLRLEAKAETHLLVLKNSESETKI